MNLRGKRHGHKGVPLWTGLETRQAQRGRGVNLARSFGQGPDRHGGQPLPVIEIR